MKHIGIITNEHKDPGLKVTGYIREFLEKRSVKCSVAVRKKIGTGVEEAADDDSVLQQADVILVLGGDGTMLQAARDTIGWEVPLLGVNLGTLGYLAEVEQGGMEEALYQLLEDKYTVEKRMMLDGRIQKNGEWTQKDHALNDIVLSRQGSLQVINFDILVNGQHLNTCCADGMIVATPTGSTGYNMSAGGPIVEPDARILLLTPICSHNLNSRSIVLSPQDEIVIRVGEGKEGQKQTVEVSFDGKHAVELFTGDLVEIRQSEKATGIMKLNKVSFLEVLRRKMNAQ